MGFPNSDTAIAQLAMNSQAIAARRAPEAQCAISAAGDDAGAVRAEGAGSDPTPMALEDHDFLAACSVPEAQREIGRAHV